MNADERDAGRKARRVEAYWRAHGYASVSCEVVPVVHDKALTTYEVRCNLVNGLPPDFRPEDLPRLRNAR